jgi:hypothetical protein
MKAASRARQSEPGRIEKGGGRMCDKDDDYWDRDFDDDSDDEYDAIRDWALSTDQTYSEVDEQRKNGTLGRPRR